MKPERLKMDADSSEESASVPAKVSTQRKRLRRDNDCKETRTVKRKQSNTLLSMIRDRSTSSESDNDDRKTSPGLIEYRENRRSETSKKNPSETESHGSVQQETMKRKKSSTDSDSSVSIRVSGKDTEQKSVMSRRNSNRETNHKRDTKRSNILQTMIDVSSDNSEEDDKIGDRSAKSLGNAKSERKRKATVRQIESSSDTEEEPLRNIHSSVKQEKTLKGDKSQEKYESVKLEATIKPEIPSSDSDTCSNVAKSKPEVRKENGTHVKADKEQQSKMLLWMIHDSSDDSDYGAKKIADSSEKSERKSKATVRRIETSSDTEEEHPSSGSKPLRDIHPSVQQEKTLKGNKSQKKYESVKLEATIKPEIPSSDSDTCSNVAKSKPEVRKENGTHAKADKEQQSKMLLRMIHDSSDDSDYGAKNIADSSAKSLDKRKRKKKEAGVGKKIETNDEKEERQSSNTKDGQRQTIERFRSQSSKTLTDYSPKPPKKNKNSSKKEPENSEVVGIVKFENCSMDEDSKADTSRKEKKRKSQKTSAKAKSNTLLSIIDGNSSGSDRDDERIKIEADSDVSDNKTNLSRRIRLDGSDAESTDDVNGTRSPVKNPLAKKSRNFDVAVKARSMDEDSKNTSRKEKKRKSQKTFAKAKSNTLLSIIDGNSSGSDRDAERIKIKADSEVSDNKTNPSRRIGLDGSDAESTDDENGTHCPIKNPLAKKSQNFDVEVKARSMDEDSKNTSRKEKKRKSQKISAKAKSNTLLSIIDGNSSCSDRDDGRIKIEADSDVSDNKTNLSRRIRSDSPDDENGTHSPVKKSVAKRSRNFDVEVEARSMDEDSKADTSRKEKKRKAQKTSAEAKSDTLLSIIDGNSSGSARDDKRMKIEADSDDSDNATNLRRRIKFDGSDAESSDDENRTPSSVKKPVVKKESALQAKKSRNSDVEVEAEDLAHLINVMEEEEMVPRESLIKIRNLDIKLQHKVPPQHMVETYAGSRGPTHEQKDIIEKFGPIKYGKYAPEEDDTIVDNWKSFCKVHGWDMRDVKPFLCMRHQYNGYFGDFPSRLKFVQYLANGLPWRTLYSVYWRFRNLYRPHIVTRYTEDEDRLIIAHMENSSAVGTRNKRKFSELSKILNRTRASVWRRYRLLKRKRDFDQKPQYDIHLAKKMIKNLIQLMLVKDVSGLKDLDIPIAVWNMLSEKCGIESNNLKQFWQTKLHMQLFCKEPIYLNDIKIKIIEYLYVTGVTEWWQIEWANIAKYFDGMTPVFLCKIFSSLIRDEGLEGQELTEILKQLYEVKKPEMQEAPMDKSLPRLVFKHGSLKLLRAEKK